MRHLRAVTIAAAVGVAVLVVLTVYALSLGSSSTSATNRSECGASPGPALSPANVTGDLPSSFAKGSIQAFGSNDSSGIFGGVSFYDRNREPFDSLPALGAFSPATSATQDLTNQTSGYFAEGGVFPVGWNGSGWLIAGQTTIGPITEGSAIALRDGQITNLTSLVAPYFQGEGIWIAGWNGTGWLLGGNNTQGAALVYLEGGTVTNLTALLPNNGPTDWVQGLAWNGTGWLVGGQGIFGALDGGRYTNLLPGSPFESGGVLAMDWNGSAWLVGGSPTGLAYVYGTEVRAGPSPSPNVGGWVNSVVADPSGGWIVSGGTYSDGLYSPFLAAVTANPAHAGVVDESSCLPGAFDGGWVQYGAWAPAFGPNALLLVGEGGTDPSTFTSHAAATVLTVGA